MEQQVKSIHLIAHYLKGWKVRLFVQVTIIYWSVRSVASSNLFPTLGEEADIAEEPRKVGIDGVGIGWLEHGG